MSKKHEIIQEIKRIAGNLKTTSLSKKDFQKRSEISISKIRYHFGSWNKAVEEAGLTPIEGTERLKRIHQNQTIEDSALLLDLIRLFDEYHKEPTESLVNSKGKYSTKPYRKRWNSIKEAFLIAKKNYPEEIASEGEKNVETDNIKVIPKTIKPKAEKKKRTVFGEPIDFRGLRFAPVNEQGVVYLFGMISHELGYLIESIRTDYPDCEGKRCFDKDKNQWEHIRIEFEYKSSNFRDHAHNEEGCDLIVCWIHDWEDCPIEVLELRSTIKYL